MNSNAVLRLAGELLCFRKPWVFDGKPGCGGWLPVQALGHSSKVNSDVYSQSAGLLLQQAILVLIPSGCNLGSAAGEETPEERSLLP